jgi:D-glycero-D-manno-heptose 1,7-bisphosphate phosphatase
MNCLFNKALFLDRDGVINIDFGHVHRIENFVFIDGIFDLCLAAQQKGYLIIVVTNQAGIGKGLYTEDEFMKLNSWMINQFKIKGVNISKTYYCPHKPEDECNCRKPNPGMILKATEEFNIKPSDSILIGDNISDILACNNAKIGRCVKINQYKLKDFYTLFDR